MKRLFHIAYTLFITVALLYCAFMAGRIYEVNKFVKERQASEQVQLKKKIKKHGSGYHYIEERGKLYMVKNVKDIDNRKKWVPI